MKISKAEEHALRLVMSLAERGGQATMMELSADEQMPATSIAKICGHLRRGGIIIAQRGRAGGYILSRPASEITVADVIRAQGRPLLEGVNCAPGDWDGPGCPRTANCGLRSVWTHLAQRIADVLEQTSIADLNLEESTAASRLIMRLDGQQPERSQGVMRP